MFLVLAGPDKVPEGVVRVDFDERNDEGEDTKFPLMRLPSLFK